MMFSFGNQYPDSSRDLEALQRRAL